MHNLDRILNEEMGHEYGYTNEYEFAPEQEWEAQYEFESGLSNEQMEYEMAAELLAVTNEAELDQFLSKLIGRAAKGVSTFARSSAGRALIGGLKTVAKKALPIVGKVAGSAFGGPIGGMIGSKLGTVASNLFEIQMEGMSNEDREFEVARRVVRLSTTAAQNAASITQKNPTAPAKAIAIGAIKQAASKHAPGLLTPVGIPAAPLSGGSGGPSANTSTTTGGTWFRQGNNIIINL